MKPYIPAAVLGNGRMLATLGSNGELYRLFWPHIDMSQHINNTYLSVLSPVMGDRAVRADDEGNWVYSQEYIGDSGVLKTTAKFKRGGIQVSGLDFVTPDRDILVRCYQVSNLSENPIPVVLLYYSCLHLNESQRYNSTRFDNDYDALFHYRQETWIAVAGEKVPGDYQCGWCCDGSYSGNLSGNTVAMASDGCQAWNLDVIEPGQSKTLAIYITAGNNREQALENVLYARRTGWEDLLQETSGFWENYIEKGKQPDCHNNRVLDLWKRSVMVCKLLMNRETGGIIAAPEFDESYKCSGGYAYCWGRDGAIIAHSMLKSGYTDYAREFYRWAVKYQNPGGDWPQRQYTNGQWAPGWGDQVDETGAILWAMEQFYAQTQDRTFLGEIWAAVANAAGFLMNWIEDQDGLAQMSWDLWEERFGEHAYSFAAVFAGLQGAGRLAEAKGEDGMAHGWLQASVNLRHKITEYFYDGELRRFVRSRWKAVNCDEFERRKMAGEQVREIIGPKGYITYEVFGDSMPDSSLLGLVVPYGVVEADDSRMQETARSIVETLTNQATGGIKRYTEDHYIGGNPWVLTTLWLGMYEGTAGDWDGAYRRLQWAIDHQTPLGFLPEQVDRETGQTAWVVPLAWSHAMFLLLANMIDESGEFARLCGDRRL